MTKLLYAIGLSGCMLMGVSACQPNSDSPENKTDIDSSQYLTPSPESQAMIEEFKSEYVTRVLEQQENQQVAYDALHPYPSDDEDNDEGNEEALTTTSDTAQGTDDNVAEETETQGNQRNNESDPALEPPQDDLLDNIDDSTNNTGAEGAQQSSDDSNELIDVSQLEPMEEAQIEEIEAQRDAIIDPLPIDEINDEAAEPLPLATIKIPPPEILSAEQIEERYQTAMQDLYLPDGVLLPTQSADTLLSIATLVPNLFKDEELAKRLTAKSPAMARLLRQYQRWEQIEAQQSIELAQLKAKRIEEQEAQRERFAILMQEFDETIQGYDEQIAKYEKLLEEFEQ